MLRNWRGRFGGISKSSCITVPNKYSIWIKRTQLYLTRLNKQNDKGKIIVHTSCRISFRNKKKTFQKRHGLINLPESSSEESARTHMSDSPLKHAVRSAVLYVMKLELSIMKHKTMVDLQRQHRRTRQMKYNILPGVVDLQSSGPNAPVIQLLWRPVGGLCDHI